MACRIQIENSLKNELQTRIVAEGIDVARLDVAQKKADAINKEYGHTIIRVREGLTTNKIGITIPKEWIDQQQDYWETIEEEEARGIQVEDAERAGVEYSDRYMFQIDTESPTQVSPEIVQKLSDFKLFEDRDKLCASGICNGTALRATRKLHEVGLNPFPVLTGSELSVTVKSPLGDFNITHYVAAVAIENGIYIYDMPQNEFISDDFYGRDSAVKVKTAYEPRLIPLTADEIMANYNLSEEEALKFIRSILNTEYHGYSTLEGEGEFKLISFKNYIRDNIKDGQEYINQLEEEIKNGGLLRTSHLEYLEEQKEKEEESGADKIRKSKTDWLSPKEVDKVERLLETKLKMRTREYVPKTKERFVLSELLKNIIGENSFSYNYSEGLDSVLYKLRNFLKTDEFLNRLWNNYETANRKLSEVNKTINRIFNKRRLMLEFLKRAKSQGWDNALSKYSSTQRYIIRVTLSQRDISRYSSEKQRIAALTNKYSNPSVYIEGKQTIDDLFKQRFKASKQVHKAKTIIDFLRVANVDTTYLADVIENEARRQYSYFNRRGQEYFQQDENIAPASPEIIKQMKAVAEKMGISIQKMSDYLKGNPEIQSTGINALADLTRKTIAIAEGKEDVAITEEIVHIVSAMIEQVNPKMITEMLSKIGNFAIYKQVLKKYKKNKHYQLSNGKPDIRKIKREAVDKLIAELIVNENTGDEYFPELADEESRSLVRRWWGKLMDEIRALYRKAGIDIFREAAEIIKKGEVENVEIEGKVMFQLSEAQTDLQQKLLATDENIRKVESEEKADPLLMDESEATNWYERQKDDGTWVRVKKRVTDRVKQWYRNKFGTKDFTPEEKAINEFKREHGVTYHGFYEEIHGRYFNSDGTRKTKVDMRPFIKDPIEERIYVKLEQYFVELVDSFSKDGKTPLVFSEKVIYDAKEDEAGTVDLMIVEEDGKVNIFDWKFMSVSAGAEDVAWYKKGAYNVQLGRYKNILKNVYGVKSIGMNRAIPIIMDIKRQNFKDKKSPLKITGIKVGSVNAQEIEDLTLVPVSEETESTGEQKLDKLIKKLNDVLRQVGKQEVTTEEEKEFKSDRLNALQKAVRMLQSQSVINPLIEVIQDTRTEGTMIMDDYNQIYKGKDPKSSEFSKQQLSDFAEQMAEYLDAAEVFANITSYIEDLIFKPVMLEEAKTPEEVADAKARKKLLEDIRQEQAIIKSAQEEIQEIRGEFVDKFVGQRNNMVGLLSPEATVKWLTRTFNSASEIPLKSVQLLQRLVENARGMASRSALKEINSIMELRKRLLEKGDIREQIKKIQQKTQDNKLVNKLIHKYSRDFYDQVEENAKEGNRDKKWLKDNIDVDGYKKEAFEIMNRKIEYLKRRYADNDELREKLILDEKKKWDIDRFDFNGWNNYVIKRHPLTKWYSEEYKEIMKDQDLLDLYNIVTKINNRARDVGYIQNKIATTFLPFVRKSLAEQLSWSMDISAIKNWSNSLKIDASTVGYGKINELNGQLEYSLPKYFTHDFTRTEEGENDYSDVSEDLFKNLIMYVSHVEKYAYMSEIEGQVKAIKDVEKFKEHHLVSNRGGGIAFNEEGEPETEKGNEENARLYDEFMRGIFYEQKMPLTTDDMPISLGVMEYMKRAINKVAGHQVFTPKDKPSAISLVKAMDMANRAFSIKTLGFELPSGIVNAFGGIIQTLTQAGQYFKQREFLANVGKLIKNEFINDDEREMFIQLIDNFMPLKEDPSYELMKKAGLSTLTRTNFSDLLMVFMRKPELHLEKSIFLTLLDNMMVENGKIISIREYVKKKNSDRFDSAGQYKESKLKIEEEVNELKKTRSISATKKLEDGKLVIPGLDLSNTEELQRLTTLTRRISRNATGGTSESDRNRASMDIWLRSMMVFKNWIPKLVQTRFKSLQQVSDDFSVTINEDGLSEGDKYDIGRIRLWFYTLGTDIRDRSLNVRNIVLMNDEGLKVLDRMYTDMAESYYQRTGKQFTMSRDDFYDMVRNNLSNQVKELAMLFSLFGATLAMGMMEPPEDADKSTKNAYRFMQKVVDKFVNELSFFYNPLEFQRLLSGSAFPAIGILNDIEKFITHTTMEWTGYDITNPDLSMDEVREKAQPVKYMMKMFPVTKSAVTYGAILSNDFAKEFDVTVPKTSRR